MAILIDKKTPVKRVLSSDSEKPKAEQTTFLFQSLTLRKVARVEKIFNQLNENPDSETVLDLMAEVVGMVLMSPGWENLMDPENPKQEYPFDEALENKFEVFPIELVMEIIQESLSMNKLTEDEKGNSK